MDIEETKVEDKPAEPTELDRVKAELEQVKLQLRMAHETRCAEELQEVLSRRNCTLGPGPDGRLGVTWKG